MTYTLDNIPQSLKILQEKILAFRENKQLELQNGDTGYASAPSNIALLKYWGKQAGQNQIPTNSSLSFTLGGFRSFTQVTVLGRFFPLQEKNLTTKYKHQLILKDENKLIISKEMPEKMHLFLNSLFSPFANEIAIRIESMNNFPTACGIASSASGYAALVAAVANLLQLEKRFTHNELEYWLNEWSRLGSGSATRSSLLPENSLFVAWKLEQQSLESQEQMHTKTEAVKYHKNWRYIKHCVLVLDKEQKSISSSDGHKFAQTSPFHAIRVAGIPFKFNRLQQAIKEFDFETVKQITEEDAFFMHAVMQTGTQPSCYLNSESAKIIATFIQYRDLLNLKAFWTLDAGPNIHFIYCHQHENLFFDFIAKAQELTDKKIKIYQNKQGNECVLLGNKWNTNPSKSLDEATQARGQRAYTRHT